MSRCPYKDVLSRAIVRYVRALDSRDWEDSFIRLWGVLELLTDPGAEGYKVTIRRASFLFEDRDYSCQVLSHLRDYRNKSVHAGSESNAIETLLYQLKKNVEVLIRFHIANGFKFSSLIEAAEFMDLPTDKRVIERKLRSLANAKRFRSGQQIAWRRSKP